MLPRYQCLADSGAFSFIVLVFLMMLFCFLVNMLTFFVLSENATIIICLRF